MVMVMVMVMTTTEEKRTRSGAAVFTGPENTGHEVVVQ